MDATWLLGHINLFRIWGRRDRKDETPEERSSGDTEVPGGEPEAPQSPQPTPPGSEPEAYPADPESPQGEAPAPPGREEADSKAEPEMEDLPATGEEMSKAGEPEVEAGAEPAGDELWLIPFPGGELSFPAAGYSNSREHLLDELCRIDLLVRAQVLRWQQLLAYSKPENLWGMIHVSHAEVEAYLNSPCLPPGMLPPGVEEGLKDFWKAADLVGDAIRERLGRTENPGRLRMIRLRQRFGLDALGRDLLLICLLPEIDGRYRRLFGYLQDDASRTQPTAELALQILSPLGSSLQAGRQALSAGSPLVQHHLLVTGGEARGDDGLSMRSLRLDDRIAAYLLGVDAFDSRLTDVVSFPTQTNPASLPILYPKQGTDLQHLADWWQERRMDPQAGAVIFLRGPYGSGRLQVAREICASVGERLLAASIQQALQSPASWEETVDLCYREATLQGAALYWTGCEVLLERDQPPTRWEALVTAAERFRGLTFLCSQTGWDPAGRFRQVPFIHLELLAPHYALRKKLWRVYLSQGVRFAGLPPDLEGLAGDLANDFQLTEGQIRDALATAQGEAILRDPREIRLTRQDLYEGCRRQSSRQLMTFSRRVEPRQTLTLDDLILPPANKQQLLELNSRIRNRNKVYYELGFERHLSLGKGLIALFTGTSGTGKTMAAEILANQHGVDLYKVDLSAVVSKWVGETEKNLSRVFAEAEGANAILFFDEADALFGKRGEVKEAQDRWANMEVNYLLQRVEEYAGTVILASNLKQNLDEAFMRRIQVIVEFPFPDGPARAQIFRVTFPETVIPPGEEELERVAGLFRVTGGSIKNIVLEATFRAEAEGYRAQNGDLHVGLRHMVLATAREYQKLGRPLTKGEFGEEFYAWIAEEILLDSEKQLRYA